MWSFSTLHEKLDAYQALIENHYRYYQHFSNMLLSLAFAYLTRFFAISWQTYHVGMVDLGFVVVEIVLFFGSRDALRKYYRRAGELLITHEGR